MTIKIEGREALVKSYGIKLAPSTPSAPSVKTSGGGAKAVSPAPSYTEPPKGTYIIQKASGTQELRSTRGELISTVTPIPRPAGAESFGVIPAGQPSGYVGGIGPERISQKTIEAGYAPRITEPIPLQPLVSRAVFTTQTLAGPTPVPPTKTEEELRIQVSQYTGLPSGSVTKEMIQIQREMEAKSYSPRAAGTSFGVLRAGATEYEGGLGPRGEVTPTELARSVSGVSSLKYDAPSKQIVAVTESGQSIPLSSLSPTARSALRDTLGSFSSQFEKLGLTDVKINPTTGEIFSSTPSVLDITNLRYDVTSNQIVAVTSSGKDVPLSELSSRTRALLKPTIKDMEHQFREFGPAGGGVQDAKINAATGEVSYKLPTGTTQDYYPQKAYEISGKDLIPSLPSGATALQAVQAATAMTKIAREQSVLGIPAGIPYVAGAYFKPTELGISLPPDTYKGKKLTAEVLAAREYLGKLEKEKGPFRAELERGLMIGESIPFGLKEERQATSARMREVGEQFKAGVQIPLPISAQVVMFPLFPLIAAEYGAKIFLEASTQFGEAIPKIPEATVGFGLAGLTVAKATVMLPYEILTGPFSPSFYSMKGEKDIEKVYPYSKSVMITAGDIGAYAITHPIEAAGTALVFLGTHELGKTGGKAIGEVGAKGIKVRLETAQPIIESVVAGKVVGETKPIDIIIKTPEKPTTLTTGTQRLISGEVMPQAVKYEMEVFYPAETLKEQQLLRDIKGIDITAPQVLGKDIISAIPEQKGFQWTGVGIQEYVPTGTKTVWYGYLPEKATALVKVAEEGGLRLTGKVSESAGGTILDLKRFEEPELKLVETRYFKEKTPVVEGYTPEGGLTFEIGKFKEAEVGAKGIAEAATHRAIIEAKAIKEQFGLFGKIEKPIGDVLIDTKTRAIFREQAEAFTRGQPELEAVLGTKEPTVISAVTKAEVTYAGKKLPESFEISEIQLMGETEKFGGKTVTPIYAGKGKFGEILTYVIGEEKPRTITTGLFGGAKIEYKYFQEIFRMGIQEEPVTGAGVLYTGIKPTAPIYADIPRGFAGIDFGAIEKLTKPFVYIGEKAREEITPMTKGVRKTPWEKTFPKEEVPKAEVKPQKEKPTDVGKGVQQIEIVKEKEVTKEKYRYVPMEETYKELIAGTEERLTGIEREMFISKMEELGGKVGAIPIMTMPSIKQMEIEQQIQKPFEGIPTTKPYAIQRPFEIQPQKPIDLTKPFEVPKQIPIEIQRPFQIDLTKLHVLSPPIRPFEVPKQIPIEIQRPFEIQPPDIVPQQPLPAIKIPPRTIITRFFEPIKLDSGPPSRPSPTFGAGVRGGRKSRAILANLGAVTQSLAFYGKATMPSLKKRPYLFKGSTFEVGTVEQLSKKPKGFKTSRKKGRWLL
jgi:hypothetical protein